MVNSFQLTSSTKLCLAHGLTGYEGLFDGVLEINGGIYSIDSDYCLGYSTVAPSMNGGVLASTQTMSTSRNFTLESSGGNFQPASSTMLTLSGVISGASGALIQSGPGTLVLSNTNSYGGGTMISSGTLSVTSESNIGGATASLFLSGGTLQTTGSFTTSGAVSVTVNSTLNSADATVLAGMLTGSDGVTLTLSGSGTNSLASVLVNSTDSFTIAGTLGGSQPLTKSGTGTLILTGTNTYTDATTVSAGTLVVNGLNGPSPITVQSGAVLKGIGTVGAVAVQSGATLNPGNSIEMMSSGSVVFSSGSIFSVEADPTTASLLDVAGTAMLAGALHMTFDPGSYSNTGNYLIIETTGGITGSFDSVRASGLNFPFKLNIMGNDLYFSYNGISLSNLSGNALSVANYLNSNASFSTAALLSGLNGESLTQALNSISPSRNAFSAFIQAQTAFSLVGLVSGRANKYRGASAHSSQDNFTARLTANNSDEVAMPVSSGQPLLGWVSGFSELSSQAASFGNPSFDYFTGAILTGIDYQGKNGALAGGALGYAYTHYYEDQDAGSGHVNYYFASFYANIPVHHFYFSPAVWGLFNQTDNQRHVFFPGFSETAQANIYSWQLVPHLEVGYDIVYPWGQITPFTAADWAISWQRGYAEQGAAPFNATQKGHSSSMVRSETGLKFLQKWTKNWGAFYLREKGSYIFEKSFGIGTVNASFVGTPGAFTVVSVNQNLNLGSAGLDFTIAIGKKAPVTIEFSYEGEFGAHYISNEVLLTIAKSF